MGERTAPIVHQGGFDVDYDWQIPGVERWLRQQGFTEDQIPYSAETAPKVVVPAVTAAASRGKSTGRVLITTSPFGELDPEPIRLLEKENITFVTNPFGRRLREEEAFSWSRSLRIVCQRARLAARGMGYEGETVTVITPL